MLGFGPISGSAISAVWVSTISKTIGTGGDYADPQSWFNASPADLTAVNQIWQGLLLNQTFTATTGNHLLNMSGVTTDADRYVELTTAPGASFRDNVSVQTNALRANAANGALLTSTQDFRTVITCSVNYTRLSKLQITRTTSTSSNPALDMSVAGSGTFTCDVDGCIIENSVGPANIGAAKFYGSGSKLRNSLVIVRKAAASCIAFIANGAKAYNCTFAVPSNFSVASAGVNGSYASPTFENCGFWNVNAVSSGGTAPTFTTCASDSVIPPTGVTTVNYTTSGPGAKFVNITDGTHDYRIQSGSALIDAGTADATNSAVGIAGTSRPQGSGYDIGAWEFVAAAGNTIVVPLATLALTGHAPVMVLSANQFVTVPLATLALTGHAPVMVQSGNRIVTVPLATLALAGFAPSVLATQNKFIAVPPAALALTGHAPVLVRSGNQVVLVPAAALALTGLAPTVHATANRVVLVPPAALALTGLPPGITVSNAQRILVPAGVLTLAALAPSVLATANQTVQVPAGVIQLAGLAPTLIIGDNKRVLVPAGVLRLVAYAPVINGNILTVVAEPLWCLQDDLKSYVFTYTAGINVVDTESDLWYRSVSVDLTTRQ